MEDKGRGNLIGSDKVEGTAVYGADSKQIGTIERVINAGISASGQGAHHTAADGSLEAHIAC